MANPALGTGEIEVAAAELEVLAAADTPPFVIEDRVEADELLRLEYRYLHLRRPEMTKAQHGQRDLSYLKPPKFRNHVTLVELSRIVNRDPSRIKQLERAGRIPVPARIKRGTLEIRLWSPAQVEEIREIISQMRPGRPRGS